MLRLSVLCAALLGSTSAFAQAPQETSQAWLLLTATGKVDSGLRWYGEVQPRFNLPTRTLERVLVRAAAGYQLGAKTSAWVGYAWTPLVQPAYADEQRPFLQFLIEDPLGSLKVVNRSRLEARFIEGAPSVSIRARHMFRLSAPIGAGFGLAAYDELFVNLNNRMGLDQNRAFAGVNYAVTKQLTVEAGYIHNYVFRPTQPSDRLNHVAILWLGYTK